MALYPNTPFVDGQVVTPDLLYTAYNPVFNDLTQYLGNLARLSDDSLSNAAGQIKSRVSAVTENFRVSVLTGLTLTQTGGSLVNNNDLITIAPSNFTVPANTSSFIFLNKLNQVVVASTIPAIRVMLAVVVTNASGVISLFDLRARGGFPTLNPNLSTITVYGGQGEDGDYVATNGDTLSRGSYNFSSFTVGAGISISIPLFCIINVSGAVNIAGTITVKNNVLSSAVGIWRNAAGSSIPGIAGQGVGSAGGEVPASTYAATQQPYGSDGSSSSILWTGTGSAGARTSAGGGGGGGLIIKAVGTILITSTGTISVNGTNGQAATATVNGSCTALVGASSGGSGGYLSLSSITSVVNQGNIFARGGGGGLGSNYGGTTLGAEGGCGGGGGLVEFNAPTITNIGSISVLGGVGDPVTYNNANVAINVPGGSFAGLGGTANSFIGTNGNVGLYTPRLVSPS